MARGKCSSALAILNSSTDQMLAGSADAFWRALTAYIFVLMAVYIACAAEARLTTTSAFFERSERAEFEPGALATRPFCAEFDVDARVLSSAQITRRRDS